MICPIYDQCKKYLRHLTDQTIDLFMPYLGLSLFGVELVFNLALAKKQGKEVPYRPRATLNHNKRMEQAY